MATTPRGFPYPADYGAAADVPADMQALAEAVDGSARVGRATITVTGSVASAYLDVSWPAITGNLAVFTQVYGTGVPINAWVTNLTSTGCRITAQRLDGQNLTANVAVSYFVARY